MYSLLLSLLSSQTIQVYFRICINLVQLTRSNAFCQSMKQVYSSSPTSKLRSDIILRIQIASVSFSFSKFKLIFSKYVLNFLFNLRYQSLLFVRCGGLGDDRSVLKLSVSCRRYLLQRQWNPLTNLQFHISCWSVVSLVWDQLLPTIWVHPKVHHHYLVWLPYPSPPW